MGSSEVAGMGIGSKIHQTAQSVVTAAVQATSAEAPRACSRRKTARAASGPAYSAIRRTMVGSGPSVFGGQHEDPVRHRLVHAEDLPVDLVLFDAVVVQAHQARLAPAGVPGGDEVGIVAVMPALRRPECHHAHRVVVPVDTEDRLRTGGVADAHEEGGMPFHGIVGQPRQGEALVEGVADDPEAERVLPLGTGRTAGNRAVGVVGGLAVEGDPEHGRLVHEAVDAHLAVGEMGIGAVGRILAPHAVAVGHDSAAFGAVGPEDTVALEVQRLRPPPRLAAVRLVHRGDDLLRRQTVVAGRGRQRRQQADARGRHGRDGVRRPGHCSSSITPQAMRAPAAPVGWVSKSSGSACTITERPTMPVSPSKVSSSPSSRSKRAWPCSSKVILPRSPAWCWSSGSSGEPWGAPAGLKCGPAEVPSAALQSPTSWIWMALVPGSPPSSTPPITIGPSKAVKTTAPLTEEPDFGSMRAIARSVLPAVWRACGCAAAGSAADFCSIGGGDSPPQAASRTAQAAAAARPFRYSPMDRSLSIEVLILLVNSGRQRRRLSAPGASIVSAGSRTACRPDGRSEQRRAACR